MLVTIMKQEFPVCHVSVNCLATAGAIVNDYEVLSNELMPMHELWRDDFNKHQVLAFLREWFRTRVLDDRDPNLDETMFRVYDLNQCHYGRMHGYQYIGGFLAYMTSSEDDYWVNPRCTQYMSYCIVDKYFTKLYEWNPSTYKEAKTAGGVFRECLRKP